jgi:hypothetical protein
MGKGKWERANGERGNGEGQMERGQMERGGIGKVVYIEVETQASLSLTCLIHLYMNLNSPIIQFSLSLSSLSAAQVSGTLKSVNPKVVKLSSNLSTLKFSNLSTRKLSNRELKSDNPKRRQI